MTSHFISISNARKIILRQQFLSDFNGSMSEIIDHLGYIQIDSIYVVERAHNHTLWSRCPEFTPDDLSNLHGNEKAVFEYWAHAMSYLPMSDYRFSLPLMQTFREREDCREILSNNKKLVKDIRKRIMAEGPVSASDFEAPPDFKGGGWWERKPAKQILEVLYWQGELMISHRKNFKRYYDLTERAFSLTGEKPSTLMPSHEETHRHYLMRVFRTLGVANKADLLWFIKDKTTATSVLNEMIGAGEVQLLKIENLADQYYALKTVLENSLSIHFEYGGNTGQNGQKVHILSPFDNMMIRRDFVKRLFNFDYVFECYVPQANRKFGYFSCPILAGTDLIGTIDAKADRSDRMLIVKNLHLSDFPAKSCDKENLVRAVARRISEFSSFNGCSSIKMECQNKWAKAIEKRLKSAQD
ncbi:MAG: winged helix DNA-binding domain-containing protein [Candidatus Riflebacteria bacterium]|nr:winged helix DNA-binding domain-containing protein [Candidatus Riflebacteria bacterium]